MMPFSKIAMHLLIGMLFNSHVVDAGPAGALTVYGTCQLGYNVALATAVLPVEESWEPSLWVPELRLCLVLVRLNRAIACMFCLDSRRLSELF